MGVQRKRSVAVALTLTSTSMWLLGATPASAAPRCFGEPATIVGTPRRDVLRGTNGDDVIVGLGGNDVLIGRNGNDLLCSGGGHDIAVGGDGNDRLHGGGGDDGLQPGSGRDFVNGGASRFDDVRYPDANSSIRGSLITNRVAGHGTDRLSNIEQIVGGPFNDALRGDDGPVNVLIGLGGDDMLTGGGDFDFLVGGDGDDVIDGGGGFDFAENYRVDDFMSNRVLAGPVVVDLIAGTSTGNGNDTLVSVEGASGSLGNDVFVGTDGDNEFSRMFEGTDTVDAGSGNDFVDGGAGADDLDGGPGEDLLSHLDSDGGMTANLNVLSNSDGDTLAGFEHLWGTFFGDVLTGTDGPNEIVGFDGNDQLFGLDGDDFLIGDYTDFGGAGTDSADGGLGSDVCFAETEVNCEFDPSLGMTATSVLRMMPAKGTWG